MSSFLDDYLCTIAARLEGLKTSQLHRRLEEPRGIDFSSNDYLGLSRHPLLPQRLEKKLRESHDVPLSAPASRLLAGTTAAHLRLEERLARFKGTEAALLFPSGYQANLGVLTALLGPADRALSDAANHASIIDGLRLSGAKKVIYPHLSVEAIREALATPHPGGRTFIVSESLFSMDGDSAPLDDYAELAERHGAGLIIDDAHATGVYGDERGSGLAEKLKVERRAVAIVSTCGKALGLAGAFVAAPRLVVEYLVNRARQFIFTTAPPPLLLYAIDIALDLLDEEPERRKLVLSLAGRLRGLLREHRIDGGAGDGPIVPIVLGDNRRALEAAAAMARRGFDVRALRPPSVPVGTARLRLSVHANHTEAQVDALAAALSEELAGITAPSLGG